MLNFGISFQNILNFMFGIKVCVRKNAGFIYENTFMLNSFILIVFLCNGNVW